MAHGGWPGGLGSSSSWRRLLRLSRLANGSSPFPAPRPRALLWRPFPSAPRDRPNWFLCSGMVPPVSLQQLRPRRKAGVGAGPAVCLPFVPPGGRREARRPASGQTDAAQVEPGALRAPRRQVGPPGRGLRLAGSATWSLSALPVVPSARGLRSPRRQPRVTFPPPSSVLATPPGVGDRASPESWRGLGSPELSSLGKGSCTLSMPSHVPGQVTERVSQCDVRRVGKETVPKDFEKRIQ